MRWLWAARTALAFMPVIATAPEILAQEPVAADPGSVVTVPVQPPEELLAEADSTGVLELSFGIEAPAHISILGPVEGTFRWEAGDPTVYPVTVRLPRRILAGLVSDISIAFAGADDRPLTVAVPIKVRRHMELEVDLAAEEEAVARGRRATFRYTVRNRGNAADSVRLNAAGDRGDTADGLPVSVWIEAFGERAGRFEIPLPPNARVGEEEYLHLEAAAPGARGSDFATYTVLPERGLAPNLVQIPTTVFLGSTFVSAEGETRAQPLVSVEGRGELARSTEILFSFRHLPYGSTGYAFRGLFANPGLMIGVRRPTWEADAGDLFARVSRLLGFMHQGRGANARWHGGRWSVQALAGAPLAPDGEVVGGHMGAFEVAFTSGLARGALLVSSTERENLPGQQGSAVRAAVARFEGARGDHWVGVEAGPMDIENLATGEREQGPSVDARYAFRKPGASVDVRVRALPDLAADPRLPPSELRAAGAAGLGRGLTAHGTVFNEAGASSSLFDGSRIRGGELGLRLGAGRWSAGLAGETRDISGGLDASRREVRVDGIATFGSLTMDGTVAIGRSRLDAASELAQRYRIGASWRAERGGANVSLTYSDDLLMPGSVLVDANGSLAVTDAVEVYASVSSWADVLRDGMPLRTLGNGLTTRTGARFRVAGRLFLYSGIERMASAGSRPEWRFSIGAQQGVPVPLPLRQPPVVSGLVFEDLDGDGVRSAEEPLLDGVQLRMGFEKITSRPGGRFEFRAAQPRLVHVETRALGPAYLPLPDLLVPDDRYMEIGVLRSGGLRVSAFLDADADGVWDEDELPATNVRLVLTRAGDETWVLETTADGSITLSSVRPGTFVIEVAARSIPRRAFEPPLQSVEVRGGETAQVVIPIPLRQIVFTRFGDDGACGEDNRCNDDD